MLPGLKGVTVEQVQILKMKIKDWNWTVVAAVEQWECT